MQWNEGDNAGFCSADAVPWLPIHANYEQVNVEAQTSDEDSLLNTYKSVLHLRNGSDALQEGQLQLLESDKQILAYSRKQADEEVLILLISEDREHTFKNSTQCQNIVFQIREIGLINHGPGQPLRSLCRHHL